MQNFVYRTLNLDIDAYPEIASFRDIWQSKRVGEALPSWGDLDFTAFPNSMIPHMILTDVSYDPLDFRYRFIGTSITDISGHDDTGLSVDDLRPKSFARAIRNQHELIVETREANFYVLTASNDTEQIELIRGIRLPLSTDGSTIDHILGCIYFSMDLHQMRKIFKKLTASPYED